MTPLPDPLHHRKADFPIDDLFLRRWSPRSMSGEPLTEQELLTLFEAARWAPSSFNEQEWRFLYARRQTEHWSLFFDLLSEGNQVWCQRAAVLGLVLSHKVFTRNGKPNPVHAFDTGAAFQNLALQGTLLGLVIHAMSGYDRGRARAQLQVPDAFELEAMFAIGRPGSPNDLPAEVAAREIPSGRKPVREFICEGKFQF